jgi:thiazole synthase
MKLNQKSEDGLRLGDRVLSSRLLMGTGKFSSREVMLDAIKASGSQLVTVALRRFNREQDAADDLYGPLS